jgi:hypothetical protein
MMCNDKIKITHFAIVTKPKNMKLTKSQKIKVLEAKVIVLKAKLKDARMELAYRDSINPIESTDQLFTTERVNESIKELENEMDNTLTIEQLKEGDVLVCNESFDIFKKGIEYPIIDIQYLGLVVKTGDSRYSKLKECLDQFTLKPKPITVKEFHPTDLPNTVDLLRQTPEPITSTTLKTPNEWLKLMSEEEVRLWEENREKADKHYFDLNENRPTTFDRFITFGSFDWSSTPQGHDYWQNISKRYNN